MDKINAKLEAFVTAILNRGCYLYRYGEVFFVDADHIKVARDHRMEDYIKQNIPFKDENAEDPLAYTIYFVHEEYPATICSYSVSSINFKEIYGSRMALYKEELLTDEKPSIDYFAARGNEPVKTTEVRIEFYHQFFEGCKLLIEDQRRPVASSSLYTLGTAERITEARFEEMCDALKRELVRRDMIILDEKRD